MPSSDSFGRNLRLRASKCATQIIEFINNPSGYLELDLLLVTPTRNVYGIISYQGRNDHKEVIFARAVIDELKKNGLNAIEVNESFRTDINLKKTAGFNRRNVSGWSQLNTILAAVNITSLNPEIERLSYMEWKSKKTS
jgi:cobalamin biosynthesis Mg chelatase CobN